MENAAVMESLIEQFVDQSAILALSRFVATENETEAKENALKVSGAFNAQEAFRKIAEDKIAERNLVQSFHKNLQLLVQKTWVEQSDAELKEQVLFRLNELCKNISEKPYSDSYLPFFNMLSDAVYLMFGVQTQSAEFGEYAMRIDPEFGIFWWYISKLPKEKKWSDEKCRLALLLGMYFLANY
ncbi:MAG: hypothetical protein II811_01500 [Spirochaetaceae bacterium]|nr:hypothetical protein [Spirochaetaceae bacterium]